MDKKRLLSSMTVVGYGMIVIFLILAIVIGVILAINGFSKPEKKVNNIVISMPENSEGVTTENNVTSISTTDTQKTISFSIAGNAGDESVDYSTREITVVINNSSTSFTPAKKEETSVWFAQMGTDGKPVQEGEGDDRHYVPVESNRITVKVNDPIVLILATTQYPDDELNDDPDKFYLKGGISHIHARSGDLLLEAQELKVQVDVPVEKFEIIVYGYDYNDTTGRKVDLTESVQKTAGISYKNIKDVSSESDEYLNLSDTTQDLLGRTMHFVGESTAKYIKGKYYTVVQGNNNTIKWEENNSLRYFIKGTELELGVRAFPENSTSAILGSFKKTIFGLERVTTDSAVIPEGSNFLNIVGFDDVTTGSIKVVATLPILLNGNERVQAEIIVETAAYEIEKLEVTSTQIQDGTINCLLNKQMAVAFNKNVHGDEDVNLGINIIPKFFNGHDNPYQDDFTSIYAELRTNHGAVSDIDAGIISVSSINESFVEPISGITTTQQVQDEKTINKTATFTANRLLFSDERALLIVSDQQNFSDTTKPYAAFVINPIINKPETNQQNVELNELVYNSEIEISFSKEDARFIELSGKEYLDTDLINGQRITNAGILSLQKENELMITYTKEAEKPIIYPTSNPNISYRWVFFVAKTDGDYESDVILLTSTGQVKSLTKYGSETFAMGQGSVDIYPKLVLCNPNGVPLNCFYQTFEVNDSTGYIFIDNIASTDLKAENENNYVVIFDPQIREKIIVTENLTDLTFFYNESLTDMVVGDVEVVANDIKYFYFIANSQAALRNSNRPTSLLEATLHTSYDDYSLSINYETNYNYASFAISDKPADNDCSVDFKQGDTLVGTLNPQIKVVDIQSIGAVFDVVQELKLNLFEEDDGRRVLYTGDNITITNTDGENLNVVNGKFYIVNKKEIDSETVYYWELDYAYTSLKYEDSIKKLKLKEIVNDNSEIVFDTQNLTFPTSVYYDLTIKRAHGNEGKTVPGIKNVNYYVFALDNNAKVIEKDDIATLVQNNLATKIEVRTVDEQLKLALHDGWKNEISTKYIYLVYTMSVGQTLKAVDSYRIDFDFSEADFEVTKKAQVEIESTMHAVSMLYAQKEDGNSTSTSTLRLDSNTGVQITDVTKLLEITDNKDSSTIDYNRDGLTIGAILMGNGGYNEGKAYDMYVTITVAVNGAFTMEVYSNEYKFTVEPYENPIAASGEYKITFQSFVAAENSNAFFAIDIPITLGFNVVYNT